MKTLFKLVTLVFMICLLIIVPTIIFTISTELISLPNTILNTFGVFLFLLAIMIVFYGIVFIVRYTFQSFNLFKDLL